MSPVWCLADESETVKFGSALAAVLHPGMVVFLDGDLGAGKTTLVRALLRARGHLGAVKSPTYSLVEVYVISSLYWYHFDFYRFNHPEEFVDAGLGEYFRNDSVCLVEWPDKAAGYVPPPDIIVSLEFDGDGRRARLSACSPEGEACLHAMSIQPAPLQTSPGANS